MGYYIDFVFHDKTVENCKDIVDKFLKQGAVVHDYKDETMPDHVRERNSNFIDLVYPEFDYFITILKKESTYLKGNWAHIRVSWGENPDSFLCLLGKILALARLVDCRVYDGQMDRFITVEDLEEIKRQFSSVASGISNKLGRCLSSGRN